MASKNKGRRFQLYSIIAAAVCFLIVIVFIINLLSRDKTVDQITDDSQTTVKQTEVQITYTKPIDFTVNLADKTAVINYKNADKNDVEYIIEYEGKVLYKNEKLAPGGTIVTATLNLPSDIKAGEYKVTVSINNLGNDGTGIIKKVTMTVK